MANAGEPSHPPSTSWFYEWRTPTVIIALITAAAGGLWVLYKYRHDEQPAAAAEQVRLCVKAHHLDGAQDDFWIDTGTSERVPANSFGRTGQARIIATCQWPPAEYSDAQGYSEIRVSTEDGPQEYESSSSNVVNRIASPCPTLQLFYTAASQGSRAALDPYEVARGEVVSAWDGSPWEGEAAPGRELPFPGRDEILVVGNSKVYLDRAQCV